MMAQEGLSWCQFDAMGNIKPVPWSEIAAFSQASGVELEPWEARQLREMSVSYVFGYIAGRNPMTVSPAFKDNPDEDPGVALERQRVSNSLETALSAMAG
ncbi:hypothetical protein KUV39_08735 [Phaeobacter italicus]|uniref:hypothetical protein n=1 Tax=Phaeobacter TaxID=302485 RepID=UPI001C95EA20|nr:hypothetical protein [Phaeobacter italicus]MBY5976731.1 hypothetical protein [Phaeobacter italicus]